MAKAKATGTAVMSTKERMAADLAQIQGNIKRPAGNRVSIDGGKFKFNSQSGDILECVILTFAARNDFFPGKFDRKNIVPPDCAAAGLRTNHYDLVPFDQIKKPECSNCDECPNNQFGSDGNGKACKNTYTLLLIVPGIDDETLFTLSVPPTSVKNFDSYVSNVADTGQVLARVKTVLTLEPVGNYSKINFEHDGLNDDVELHYARIDEAEKIAVLAPDFDGKAKKSTSTKPASKRTARKKAA